jgi:AraC-like DNA-binding protein
MTYLQRVPKPPLDGFIAAIWYCENDPKPLALERVLPSGAAQLIVNLKEDQTCVYQLEHGLRRETTSSGIVLSGVQSRFCIIDTAEQECVLGVAFRPGGLIPFFGVPAYELRDAGIPLNLLWGRRASDLREQLLAAPTPFEKLDALERAMAEMWRPIDLHPAVSFALQAFTHRPHDARISEVTGMSNLSAKRFIERFKAAVGLTPKHYCRILRFQHPLSQVDAGRRVDWTRIALDCGYFDQAHFIRDFRSFAGITPTGYREGQTQFQNHVKFLQSGRD